MPNPDVIDMEVLVGSVLVELSAPRARRRTRTTRAWATSQMGTIQTLHDEALIFTVTVTMGETMRGYGHAAARRASARTASGKADAESSRIYRIPNSGAPAVLRCRHDR